ncbi:MAG: hypothetical protein AABY64_12460 [Bdellovibrionota bacterium]
MKINTQVSKNGALVVNENEEALCSTYDPLHEASTWVQRIDIKNIKQALVLGLGAGHHIEELLKQGPDIKLSVLDCRPNLFEIFETHRPLIADRFQFFCIGEGPDLDDRIFNFVEDCQPTVLCFKPAWKNHETFFSNLFASLTFRNLQMIEKSLKVEIEKDVFDTSKLEAQKNLLHLKNLHESLKDFSNETALKISVLRELWI